VNGDVLPTLADAHTAERGRLKCSYTPALHTRALCLVQMLSLGRALCRSRGLVLADGALQQGGESNCRVFL
jgi:hypothetical protein